jgi:hypothetical protein
MEEVLFLINRNPACGVRHVVYGKETPFRLVTMKGDEMFRSIWENGERGTPELWRN